MASNKPIRPTLSSLTGGTDNKLPTIFLHSDIGYLCEVHEENFRKYPFCSLSVLFAICSPQLPERLF